MSRILDVSEQICTVDGRATESCIKLGMCRIDRPTFYLFLLGFGSLFARKLTWIWFGRSSVQFSLKTRDSDNIVIYYFM